MTTRDRLVVCGLVAVAALVAMWLGVVSPKRHDANKLGAAVTAEKVQLASAQTQLAQGVAAKGSYTANLHVVKELYKAVPSTSGVPKLLVALDKTSNYKRVDFQVINVAPAAAATTTPIAAGTPATVASVLTPVSFTFTFDGGYIALQHFIHSIDSYTLVEGNNVVARGRLLSIQGVSLTPQSGSATASVTATAYSQPAATLGAPTTTTASTATPTP
jgi:Type II secretion system (T2SS), protein M